VPLIASQAQCWGVKRNRFYTSTNVIACAGGIYAIQLTSGDICVAPADNDSVVRARPKTFTVGTAVVIFGLQKAPQHNGVVGIVEGTTRGRYVIKLPCGGTINAKSGNLNIYEGVSTTQEET
jgi:hypothetical protein